MRVSKTFVVLLALASILGFARAADAMSFRIVQVGDVGSAIVATGQITESTPSEFLAFVQDNFGSRARTVVLLDSPGGKVLASMEFGSLLRQMGASAIVAGVASTGEGRAVITNGQCFSACVYAFMGARKRVVPSSSQVGIHRMFAYEASTDSSGETSLHRRYDDGAMGSVLKRYTSEMGVSPALISEAEHIPSSGLKILSRSEIRRYHLGTAGR